VNGTYFVVEAVPITKAKSLNVVSAYMTKNAKKTEAKSRLLDAEAPRSRPEPPNAHNASTDTIIDPPENVNRVNMGDTGTNPAMGAADSGFDPYSHASIEYGAIPPGEKMSSVVDVPISIIGKSNEETQLRREMLRPIWEVVRNDTISKGNRLQRTNTSPDRWINGMSWPMAAVSRLEQSERAAP